MHSGFVESRSVYRHNWLSRINFKVSRQFISDLCSLLANETVDKLRISGEYERVFVPINPIRRASNNFAVNQVVKKHTLTVLFPTQVGPMELW